MEDGLEDFLDDFLLESGILEEEIVDLSNKSESYDESQNSSQTSSNLPPKKVKSAKLIAKQQRRNIKRRKCVFYRILKRDIRRQFPLMFLNVFNSGNHDMFESFLNTFSNSQDFKILDFTPDLSTHKQVSVMPELGKKMSSVKLIHGINDIMTFRKLQLLTVPDVAISLASPDACMIKQFLNKQHSEVLIRTRIRGTIIYDDHKLYSCMQQLQNATPATNQDDTNQSECSESNNSLSTTFKLNQDEQDLLDRFQVINLHAPPLLSSDPTIFESMSSILESNLQILPQEERREIVMEGLVTFFLDERNSIRHMKIYNQVSHC